METLRKALLRGALTGLFFGLVSLAFLAAEGREGVSRMLWYAVTIAFMTTFVAVPHAAIELHASMRPASLLRDLVAGLAGLVAGVPLVALAVLQWAYLDAFARNGSVTEAMNDVREIGERFLRPESWLFAFMFASPCGTVTTLRLRGYRWWLEVLLSTGITFAIGAPLYTYAKSARPDVFALIAGAGFALSVGTRIGDRVARAITRALGDESVPLHALGRDGVAPVVRDDRDGSAPRIEDVDDRARAKSEEPVRE
jgi:hypothetical protein